MFSENLKMQRIVCGLSQKQVAEYLNISSQSISKWEKGDALPSIEFLPKLAECLDCDVNRFFTQKECFDWEYSVAIEYFMLIADFLNNRRELPDIVPFVIDHPDSFEKSISLGKKLKTYKTINVRTIRNFFGCNVSEAQKMIDCFEDSELITKSDIQGYYLVSKDAVEGLIPLIGAYEIFFETIQSKIGS